MQSDLVDTLIDFNADVFRNIPTIVVSEELLDDLSDDPKARAVGEALVSGLQRTADYESGVITRPFLYGKALGTAHARHATRFSDGSRFGVWYGSLDLLTTVYETLYHWRRMISDMLAQIVEELVTERRVFKVRARGLLVDLRGKHKRFPQLVDPGDYGFTHALGAYLHDNGQNGLLVTSARRPEGVNLAAFKPGILSNARHHSYLAYRWVPGDTRVSVERASGRRWRWV